ncbi:MAG: 5-formyltetrahydrofolate cyclo-ligase [Christensenellaceae bacterium]
MNKIEVREKLLNMRRGLTSKYMEDESTKVFERLMSIEAFKTAKNVMVYSNFDNEIKTAVITGWLMYQGIHTFLPTVNQKTMYAANIKSAVLELSKFGVPQPAFKNAETIHPSEIDVIIVPGVAFDKNKHRVGFGCGYYDTFLKEAVHAKKIALAYDFQIVEKIDAEEHDVQMDMIVTPDEIIK